MAGREAMAARGRGIIGLAALAFAGSASAGTVPYARLVTAQILFEKIPVAQRGKVRVRVVVSHEDRLDRSPVHLWVIDHGARVDLPLAANGRLDLALRQDWIDRDVIVQTDQPQKSLRVDLDIAIPVPDRMPIRADYLQDAAVQSQAVIDAGARQMAGFLALFVTPRVKGVKITLTTCCAGAAILSGDGPVKRFEQDAKGQLAVPMAALAGAPGGALTTTAPVSVIDPWVDQ